MNEPIHRFEGKVTKIKHVETHTENNDTEESSVIIESKLADKVVVTGPRHLIEKVFKQKMGLSVFFYGNGQQTIAKAEVKKPVVPVKKK